MIRSIQRVKSFGVFRDFRWQGSIPEFKKYNLIYGWNYSGKTTLARMFRSFELKKRHEDFPDSEVQLKSNDGSIHDLSAPDTAPLFRVFNSDFVRNNLSFDDGSAEAILVLGAIDIAKQSDLDKKREERKAIILLKDTNEKKWKQIDAALAKAMSQNARDNIKNPLSIPSYDKTRFEPKVIERKSDYEEYLLSDDELRSCLALYSSQEKKSPVQDIPISITSLSELRGKTIALLKRVVIGSKPLERLKANPAVESWVDEGRLLHENKNTCQYCDQRLPANLLNDLSGHFSVDYEELMAELKVHILEITSAMEENYTCDHQANYYKEYRDLFNKEKLKIEDNIVRRGESLKILQNALVEKQTQAFKSIECPKVDDPTIEIMESFKSIYKVNAEHNARTLGFEEKRDEAFVTLENHYAAALAKDYQFSEQIDVMAGLKTLISKQKESLEKLDSAIRVLEGELSQASLGAEQINEYLFAYFGKNNLQVVVSPIDRFQIVRGSAVARNLSEGEKTAIAFAHFITSVKDGRQPLDDTCIVIDDPISSLDASHLFNTYALIKTQLSGCHQLFILTHSFEFYNLIREWVSDVEKDKIKKPQANWKKWSILHVVCKDNRESILEVIPKELLQFKSEYHYLFSLLYKFNNSGVGEFDRLLTLPNVLRRFMEAFGGIMIPLSKGLKVKLVRILPDEIVRERVWKFINHYSHQRTITRSLTIPDTSECCAVVAACLKAVNEWNNDYYKDLLSEVDDA
ncbi:MAG: AAA family ATPase [bacterium]|nr:AAA family ATPase [bacterium]